MTQSTPLMNMKNIPSNCGYIQGWKKYYGNAPSDGTCSVKMVEPSIRNTHVWGRRGYTQWELNKNEKDEEGCETTVGKRRKLISSRSMIPCPNELKNNGQCHLRFNEEHERHHYHFTRRRQGVVIHNHDGKPICRYHITGDKKCWESRNSQHRQVFAHK